MEIIKIIMMVQYIQKYTDLHQIFNAHISSESMEILSTSSALRTSPKNMIYSISRTNLNNTSNQHDNILKVESLSKQLARDQYDPIKRLQVSQDDPTEKIVKGAPKKRNLQHEKLKIIYSCYML